MGDPIKDMLRWKDRKFWHLHKMAKEVPSDRNIQIFGEQNTRYEYTSRILTKILIRSAILFVVDDLRMFLKIPRRYASVSKRYTVHMTSYVKRLYKLIGHM